MANPTDIVNSPEKRGNAISAKLCAGLAKNELRTKPIWNKHGKLSMNTCRFSASIPTPHHMGTWGLGLNSSEAKSMVQQAADSVMKAYADGISRQSVQLSLGHVHGRQKNEETRVSFV